MDARKFPIWPSGYADGSQLMSVLRKTLGWPKSKVPIGHSLYKKKMSDRVLDREMRRESSMLV